jgi:hypothetical protein
MEDTKHDRQVIHGSAETQTEESRNTEASARTVARSLANPRRVRRD